MTEESKQCQGITLKGLRCKNPAIPETDYCRHHGPEEAYVKRFFAEHREAIMSYLAGATTDPVISDIYECVKESLVAHHLVLPAPAPGQQQPDDEFATYYEMRGNYKSFTKALSQLRKGMSRDQVLQLLGVPYETHRGMRAADFKDGQFEIGAVEQTDIYLALDENLALHEVRVDYLVTDRVKTTEVRGRSTKHGTQEGVARALFVEYRIRNNVLQF